jgi:hypothetical protein
MPSDLCRRHRLNGIILRLSGRRARWCERAYDDPKRSCYLDSKYSFAKRKKRLVGQLSNPSPRLQSILCLSRSRVKRTPHSVMSPAPKRLGNGVVQRAVRKALATTDRPMRTGEVQAAVETLLGHPVAKESVSWALRVGVRGQKPCFECVAYATYRLATGR